MNELHLMAVSYGNLARAKVVSKKTPMNLKDDKARIYLLVEIQRGKEKEFSDEILFRGSLMDFKVERMNFVHDPSTS